MISLVSLRILCHLDYLADPLLAPDRMGKIMKFNSDAYAVLHASASQSEHFS
jgi:hypothetical protein